MDRPVGVSVAMSMTVSMMMSAGMPMGQPVPRRMGVIVSVPVRPVANTMEPNPDGPSVARAIVTGTRRLGRILARTLTALGVAPMHPALDFAHPVTVIDGLFFLVILFVIVCGSQHQVMGTRRMGIIAHSIAVRRQGQQPHGNG